MKKLVYIIIFIYINFKIFKEFIKNNFGYS